LPTGLIILYLPPLNWGKVQIGEGGTKGKIPVFGILERQGKGEGGDGRRPERGELIESHDQEGQEREPYLHGQIPEF